jgi:catechol 2,3-dioxygenase-like lactoylglutathione lyase family enzyme
MFTTGAMKMQLDAVSVSSRDLRRAAEFYGLLGFVFPEFTPDQKHLEPITEEGEVRLMIDEHEFVKSMTGVEPKPPTHSSFAMKCDSAATVDAAVTRVKAAGFTIVKEPWDAFWGQRYAIVADPDGYMIDLFAWV